MRRHVILAVLKRNVASYFSGVLGYLFIVGFVVAGAFVAFREEFFAKNLCTLDQLSENFPFLLLFLVPAITMGAWADERKSGTDELLFTLPATDVEILLGKYLAVLGVYTVTLLFSLSHIAVLEWLGSPDYGVLFSTYVGYWLAGAGLLAAGMFASALTNSTTVAFVLGAALCAIPVFIDRVPGINLLLEKFGINEQLGIGGQLKDFTLGLISAGGVFYFLGLAGFFLYANAVLIAKRHWAASQSTSAGLEFSARAACVGVVTVCLAYVASLVGGRCDMTSRKVFSLSETTRSVLAKIDTTKPVTLTAYVTPQVPEDYVPVQKRLLGLLRQFRHQAGSKVGIRIVEVQPLSPEAEQAAKWEIEPQRVLSQRGGRVSEEEIYLGVVANSGNDQVTIPYFERATPVELELTRAIGTVSKQERTVIGVLKTEAKLLNSMNMSTFRQEPEWRIVTELKRSYEVKEIDAKDPIDKSKIKMLIAVLPSSLSQNEMKNLVDYVKTGGPTLIFDDPVPEPFPQQGSRGLLEKTPNNPMNPGMGGGMFGGQQPGTAKADGGRASSLTKALGVSWSPDRIVVDDYAPHPEQGDRFAEIRLLFSTKEGPAGEVSGLNESEPITSGLQEILTWFAGEVRPASDSKVEFSPLLRTKRKTSGILTWDQVANPGVFGGTSINPTKTPKQDGESHVIAARLRGPKDDPINAIFVSDIDIVTDLMFYVFETEMANLKIDNTLFVMNCIDELAGEPEYVALRNRRPEQRKLTRVENSKQVFEESKAKKVRDADELATTKIDEAKARLTDIIAKLKADKSIDPGTLETIISNRTAAEQRRIDSEQKEIEREKANNVRLAKIEAQQATGAIERNIWSLAVLLPSLPAILLGIIMLTIRVLNEQRGISSDRLVAR